MRFVTCKIVRSAARIATGEELGPLTLGNLDISRDLGWVDEYVDVIWRMLQTEVSREYVVDNGRSWSLRDFVAEAERN